MYSTSIAFPKPNILSKHRTARWNNREPDMRAVGLEGKNPCKSLDLLVLGPPFDGLPECSAPFRGFFGLMQNVLAEGRASGAHEVAGTLRRRSSAEGRCGRIGLKRPPNFRCRPLKRCSPFPAAWGEMPRRRSPCLQLRIMIIIIITNRMPGD